ncbi:MAG: amidohydrolase [Thermoplasmata archaeon]
MAPTDLWVDGRVFTGRRYAEAFLVEEGRVIAVGTSTQVARQAPQGTVRHDLAGRLVVPGLIDAHMHLFHTVLQQEGVDLRGVRSLSELLDRTAAAGRSRALGPIIGRGWDHELLLEHRYPDRTDLDRIEPGRAIVLFRVCHHVAVVNSAALEMLRITKGTPDPPGGRIGRDPAGDPTGVLFDTALEPVEELVQKSFFERPHALGPTLLMASRLGLTTLASMSASAPEVRWATGSAQARSLPVRLRFYLSVGQRPRLAELRRLPWSDSVGLAGVKLFMDGSFGARTAWLSVPYTDDPGESGVPVLDGPALQASLRWAAGEGLPIAIHAIGDRALSTALKALRDDPPDHRPRIEHASLTPPDLFPLLDTVRPDLVVQPGFVASDGWIAERLGPFRARWTYAFGTLIQRGYRLAGSSDSPVETLDPWAGLQVAIDRGPDRIRLEGGAGVETLAPEVALQLYTRNAGEVLGASGLGTIEVDAPADFVVHSATDLVQAIRLGSPSIDATWRAGAAVYEKAEVVTHP